MPSSPAAWGSRSATRITVNVLGRDITATIANLREIDWTSLGINFVIVFSPGTLEAAPQTHIATARTPPGGEAALERAVTDRFPNVSAIPVKDALTALSEIVSAIGTALRATAAITLAAGTLVLAGAVAAGHRRRVYEAVVLKVLGATRGDVTPRLPDRIRHPRPRHGGDRRHPRHAGGLSRADPRHAPGLDLPAGHPGLDGGHRHCADARNRLCWDLESAGRQGGALPAQRMRAVMSRLALTLTLILLAAPAYAGQPAAPVAPQDTEEWRHAEQNARQALDKLMHSFDLLLQTMPYGVPRVDDDGNIVIPRQHPHPLPPGEEGPVRT